MADPKDTTMAALMEHIIAEGPDGLAEAFTGLFDIAMRFERERFLGAAHYERTPARRGYANGFKPKTIDIPAGTLTLDVPKTAGAPEPFHPASPERGRRSSRAVMLAAAKMYVKGVSTRDVEAVLAAIGIDPDGLAVFALPEHARSRRRTANPIERAIQQEIKRRTAKVRVFPNRDALLRLVAAVLVEIDEDRAASPRAYLDRQHPDDRARSNQISRQQVA